jgi:hypothetical protein
MESVSMASTPIVQRGSKIIAAAMGQGFIGSF